MNILEQIAASMQNKVAQRARELPFSELRESAERIDARRPFEEPLGRPGISVIAEFKRRSLSAGVLDEQRDVAEMVGAFERGGAVAVSILTESEAYGGSLKDLSAARQATKLPIMCKDFIIDPYQIYEAALAGADAVLLISRIVGESRLELLHQTADSLDLGVVLEIGEERDLERALALDIKVLSINNRDLNDLSVDFERTYDLLTDVPAGKTVISESGIGTREDLEALERVGVDAAIIGERLMLASDVERVLTALSV